MTDGVRTRTARRRRGFTFPAEHSPGSCKALRMVLILKYADSVHSLWGGAFAEGCGVRRPFEGAVQMFEMRKDHDRGDQAARRFHRGDVSASLLCTPQPHQFDLNLSASGPRP